MAHAPADVPDEARPSTTRIAVTMVVLTIIWGTTWAAIRIGLEGMPPFTGVAVRFAIAAVILLGIARYRGVRLGRERYERPLWIVNGILSFCVSYGVVYWTEQWVPSGLTSVLFATYPLFVLALAAALLPGERVGRPGALGMWIGFLGVVVIFSEDLSLLGGEKVAVAAVVMLISPAVSAVASVTIKRYGRAIHPLSITAVPMAIAAVVMGGVAASVESDARFDLDARSIGALVYLAVFGSAVTFSLYFWLLRHVEATKLSLIAYMIPVVAVAIGTLGLGEPITARILAGAACVVCGVALASVRRRPRELGSGAASDG